MKKPVKVHYKPERNTVEFLFIEDLLPDYFEHLETGEEYYVRGAVVWPEARVPGYIMVGAQKITDKVIWIYEEGEFKYISPIRGEDQVIKHTDLADFLNMAWERYFCRVFFHDIKPIRGVSTLDYLHYKRYLVQVIRESLIPDKPMFVGVPYAMDSDNADLLVLEYSQNRNIRIPRDGGIYNQLKAVRTQEPETLNAVQCLRNLLVGYERIPWREPAEESFTVARSYC